MTETGRTVLASLTPRQRQILVLVCSGLTNRPIAVRLGLREQVVRNYLRQVLFKTGMRTRTELVLFAFRHRLVECPCRNATEIARGARYADLGPLRAPTALAGQL
jgi:DNA-binding CsgD family transcriptional regulator